MQQLSLCSRYYGDLSRTQQVQNNILKWTGKSLTHFEVGLGCTRQQRYHRTPVVTVITGYKALRRL